MSIIYNGTTLENINYNNAALDKVIYNGTEVYSKSSSLYLYNYGTFASETGGDIDAYNFQSDGYAYWSITKNSDNITIQKIKGGYGYPVFFFTSKIDVTNYKYIKATYIAKEIYTAGEEAEDWLRVILSPNYHPKYTDTSLLFVANQWFTAHTETSYPLASMTGDISSYSGEYYIGMDWLNQYWDTHYGTQIIYQIELYN